MPRDAVSWKANVERNGGQKWVNLMRDDESIQREQTRKEKVKFKHNILICLPIRNKNII